MSYLMMTQHHGYEYNQAILDRELYRLASLFGAGKYIETFSEIPENGTTNTGYLHKTLSDIERTEASRLLVSIAVIVRNLNETWPINEDIGNRSVGMLYLNGREGKPKELKLFPTALHKIIHATNFRIKRSDSEHRYSGHIEPSVCLYGHHHSSDWEAELDISDFVRTIFKIY